MPAKELDYRDFGEAFVLAAVTPERVVGAVKRIAGDRVELGPLRAGPAGAALVRAKGIIGEPIADEIGGDLLAYQVRLPVDVDIEARVGAVGHFRAEGEIELRLTVRIVQPLALVIDVQPVQNHDVRFAIKARGMQSRLLQRAGDVEGELKVHAAAYVNEQISRPEAARYTRIELLPMIEKVWGEL